MFLIFLSALIFSALTYKLGVYSVIVSLFINGSKLLLLMAMVGLGVFLYRRFRYSRLMGLPNKHD